MGPKVLVTGGAGFFGTHLVTGLLNNAYQVKIVDKQELNDPESTRKMGLIKGDIRYKDQIDQACTGIDYVFHTAALVPISRASKKEFWEINVLGTQNVLEAALRNKIKKVIFISSSAPYGIPQELPINEETKFNPVCDYGRSKVEAEKICHVYRNKGLDIVILRPRTIVGKGRLGIFQILYSWIATNRNVYILGSGDNLYQSLSPEDLVQACILCIQKECRNEDFNLGADGYKTFKEELQALIDYAQSSSKLVTIPAESGRIILRVLDCFNLIPFTSWHYLTADKDFYFNSSKAKQMLGWQPKKSGIEMIQESYDWYLAHWPST